MVRSPGSAASTPYLHSRRVVLGLVTRRTTRSALVPHLLLTGTEGGALGHPSSRRNRGTRGRLRKTGPASAGIRQRRQFCEAPRRLRATPTGTATITPTGRSRRTASTAARMVEPVATPSSTKMTVRPSTRTSALSPRYLRSRRSSSVCSARVTASIAEAEGLEQVRTSSFITRTPPVRDGAHCKLWLAGEPELPHDKHVHRRRKGAGDFVGHRNSASGKRQHDQIGSVGEIPELTCKHSSSMSSVDIAPGVKRPNRESHALLRCNHDALLTVVPDVSAIDPLT